MTSPRLPADARIGHVTLAVADLDRSVDYYTRVIGLEVQTSGSANASATPQRTARLGATGGGPLLVELREQPGARPVLRNGRLGLFHFAILVPDRPALGRFLAHLHALRVTPAMADHLVSEALYLWDPDGLGIEVYVDRPRAAWRWQDDEVAMDTLPLDVSGVLAAGAGAPFTGLPMGTTIGHVHLHVGDLGAAERFYVTALGFDVTLRRYRGALFLSAGRYHHHLGTNTWAGAAPPAGPDEARLLEWELLVTRRADAEAALDRLAGGGSAGGGGVADAPAGSGPAGGGLAAGASSGTPAVTRTSDGGTATDPWGTVVRLRSQLGT